MNWLARVAAATVVRRLVGLLLVALLAYLGLGQAQAQTTTSCSTSRSIALDDCDNGETARAAAVAAATSQMNSGYNYGGAVMLCTVLETPTGADPRWYSRVVWQSMGCSHGGFSNQQYRRTFSASAYCAEGNEWDAGTQTCNPAGPTEAECLARANLGSMSSTGSSGTTCSDGCTFVPDQAETIGIQLGTEPMIYTAKSWKATGDTCTAGPANEPTPLVNDQACIDAGNGMTMCLRADGMHCASASTGKQICWRPGETGTKTTDDVAQKRVPGTNPATPPTPPEGETFNQGPSTTTTTDKNGTTVTTTTTNFTTAGGTDAGGEDSGVPGDGSGGDGAGEGDDPFDCEGCDTSDGSAGHEGDSIWGADETLEFVADEAGLGYGTTCPAVPDIALLSSAGGLDWAGLCEVLQALGLIILAAAHMHALYILLES